MPKPTPDDIPGEIRDLISAHGYTGAGELGEHIGLSNQRILTICRGKHSGLKVYKRLAGKLGITMDALVERIEAGELSTLILALVEREQKSLRTLSTELGASHNFLAEKIRFPGIGSLSTYIEVAKALNFSLERFAEILLRNRAH